MCYRREGGQNNFIAASLLSKCEFAVAQEREASIWELIGRIKEKGIFFQTLLFQFFAHHFIEETDLSCLGHLLCNSFFRILKFP